jgi:Tfp pilus assembly protein PilO
MMTHRLALRVLAYRLSRLGWPGWCGVVMAMAAGLVALTVIMPGYAEMASQDERLAVASREVERLKIQVADGSNNSPAEQLALFYEAFPAENTIPAWLEKIYASASTDGIKLESGEYSLQRAQLGRLNQYRITFPIKGAYPQIRKFISDVLVSAPAIALDSIQMKRENVGEGSVEARLVFLLYLEPAP